MIYEHLLILRKLNIGIRDISITSLLNFQFSFMSITANFSARTDYHFFYNFLLVMSEEQIQKLRRVIIGFEKISSFSENEIDELEKKAGQQNNLLTIT